MQIIMLLSALGIKDNVFEQNQAEWFQQIRAMTVDARVGLKFLMTAGKVGDLPVQCRLMQVTCTRSPACKLSLCS